MVSVLVVDDSAVMRKIIVDILSSDPEIKVLEKASDGEEAVRKAREYKPDVITMDIEMPVLDGISALKRITDENPIPVIMLSAHSKEGSDRTLEAMKAGAVDFILKPSGEISTDLDKLKDEIIKKVKSAAQAKVKKFESKAQVKAHTFSDTRKKVIVIGSSTGGPQTLEALLTELPKNIPVPILIVQHMPPDFTRSLAERLNSISQIEIREAKEGDMLQNGVALIAPGGFHMELVSEVEGMEGVIKLNTLPHELGVRPNANRLFKSVVKIFGENTIGVVLTGMGMDGTEGSRAIKDAKGTVVAEAEESCVIYGMPKSVVDENLADLVVPLENMAVTLVQLVDI